MATSPSYFVNSPAAGTTYFAPLWAGCIPNNATSWTATVKAWSGANGTGSLVVRTMTAINYDATNGLQHNSFTTSGNTVNATSSNSTNGSNVMKPGASYSGSSIGSLEIFCTYTGSAFVPSVSSFTPAIGPAGSTVTITGSHFTDATAVDFNGTAASFAVVNDTTITATVPAGATAGVLHVGSPAGTAASAGSFQPGMIWFGNGSGVPVVPVAIWYGDGSGVPHKVAGVWIGDGSGTPQRRW